LDLLNHPAFAGFAPLILPWDDRAYDDILRLDTFLETWLANEIKRRRRAKTYASWSTTSSLTG
jgi:hypothetical protein